MFFFIAGIQPKTVFLDDQPRMCSACGLYGARLKRIDHYLSVFFLPIFCIKKGEAFVECQRCGNLSSESGEIRRDIPQRRGLTCHYCGKTLETTYRFCPFCGKPV
ncbi:MAG: zinc ribbon domain-containing protein [Thermodesulfobacteriota bacterium]|nr:zinc ribbon domain-containing protein [Thermodesulfobacteriota bacterium]